CGLLRLVANEALATDLDDEDLLGRFSICSAYEWSDGRCDSRDHHCLDQYGAIHDEPPVGRLHPLIMWCCRPESPSVAASGEKGQSERKVRAFNALAEASEVWWKAAVPLHSLNPVTPGCFRQSQHPRSTKVRCPFRYPFARRSCAPAPHCWRSHSRCRAVRI